MHAVTVRKDRAEKNLTQALLDTMSNADSLLTEEEALQCALAVAEGWKMRLAEVLAEE